MASLESPNKEVNAPNREELLRMAVRAAEAGNKEGARVMFRQVLATDKRNERAMVWMAKLAQTQAERKAWLRRILAINEDNDWARKTLNKMMYQESAKANRTLLIFGVIAAVLILLAIVALIAISLR